MFGKKQLVAYGAEKLACAIQALVKNNPSNQKKLKLFFSCSDPDPVKSSKMVPLIKEKIASLRNFHGIRYKNRSYDIAQIASRIDEVRTLIVEAVLPVSPDQAITLLSDLLDIHERVIERIADEDGLTITAFQAACTDLGKAYEQTNYSLNDVVDLVYKHQMNDGYAVYHSIINDFSKVLGSNGLRELQQRLENYENENGLHHVRYGLQNIADAFDDVDAYIKAFSFKTNKKPNDYECLEIAKRLIKHGRGTEAMQWLDSANIQGIDVRLMRPLKIQALELCGDHKEAQAERLNWFETSLSHTAYIGILENAEADFVELFKITAIEKALHFANEYVVSNFLKEIKDLQLVGKLVRLKINSLDGKNMGTQGCIAEALQKKDPLAATLLFRKRIESAFAGISDYYFAKDLTACLNLSSKITDWEKFETHQQYFQRISVEFKHETSLWQEYNSALKKQNPKKAKLAINK